jgi:CubicO group peptidase (beta-lactamase class C family)
MAVPEEALVMKRALLATLVLPATLAAQQPDLAALADRVFGPWNSTHTPGCAVGVSRGGTVLLTRGYGMADLETGTPITPETIFESGSVAKQFTAAATVLLALDGKLDLDDPVRKYIPELPDYGRTVTIRHLLTHTSGLREWSDLVAAQGWPRGTRRHTQAVLFDVVTRQRSLNYPVGDYYSYTNSGYGLLFTIVERVSGKPFEQFFEQRIFGPLGMTHTRWRDDFTRLVPGRAQAYAHERDGWHLEMPFEDVVGPGGLLTTVGDWLIWNEALTNKTLGAALVDSLSHRMRLTSGREIPYALGLFFTTYRNVPEISHGGSTAGYRTFLARYPDRGNLSIAVLCNAANADAASYAHAFADALITDFPPAVAPDTTAVDSAALIRAAGVYRNDRTGTALVVSASMAPRLRALPSGWLWTSGGATWHIEPGTGGTPAGLRVAQADGDTVAFTFVSAQVWQPTARELTALEGRYRSDELDVTYQVKAAGDTLTVSPRAGLVERLRPTYPDGFEGAGTAVWFTRDRSGRVSAMHFGESRMWDLVLARQR